MSYDGKLSTFLGSGVLASRPVTPNIPAGMCAYYYGTDTTTLYLYEAGAGWVAVSSTRYTSLVTTSGAATNIAFTSIPQGYRTLILRINGQAAAAGTGAVDVLMRYNSLSSADGNYQYILGSSTTISGNANGSQTSQWIGRLPQSTNSYQYGQIEVVCTEYSSSASPQLSRGTSTYYATGQKLITLGGLWNANIAVTRIDIFLSGGGAFTNGTTAEMILET